VGIIASVLTPALATADPSLNTITAIDLKKLTIEIQAPTHSLPTLYLLSSETTVEIHGEGASLSQLTTGMLVRSFRLGSSAEPPQVLEDIDIP